jgi:hypothetical protein
MAKNAIPVTIAAGQSLSSAADLTANSVEALLLPTHLDVDPGERPFFLGSSRLLKK